MAACKLSRSGSYAASQSALAVLGQVRSARSKTIVMRSHSRRTSLAQWPVASFSRADATSPSCCM